MKLGNNIVNENNVIGRVSPIIGVYDVIKYVDPRLLHIQFLADGSFGREFMINGKDNEDQRFMTSRFPRYLEAHDRSGELIYNRVKINDLTYTITISLVWRANEKHRYYLTSIHESRSGNTMNFLDCDYEYIGQTLEDAIFKYMEQVSEYGVYK
jgi:hypothetical protein